MEAPASVVACSNCSALYTAGPGDRGFCADCRRRMPRTPPPSPPMQPVRMAAPIAPLRPTPTDTRRPTFRSRPRNLRPVVIAGVLIASVAGLLVWQRQPLANEWTKLQRHGVAREWASIERKASDLWVEIRSRLPLDSEADQKTSASATSRSHATTRDATTSRGTHRHPQVAERSSKRKGKTKRSEDFNGAGNTP